MATLTATAMSGISKINGKLAASASAWTWFDVAWTLVIVIIFITVGVSIAKTFEKPYNVRTKVEACMAAAPPIATGRKSLRDYKVKLRNELKIADNLWIVGNFYVATVNTAGLLYPAADGVFSPEAISYAAKQGARGFVFDIWPDATLKVVESGSNWRRISMNSLSFNTAFQSMIESVFAKGLNPVGTDAAEDYVVCYLRFRGTPVKATFDSVAGTLRSNMEQYRMDASFNACNGQKRIVTTNIRELASRVIIVSNTRAEKSALTDYINMAPEENYIVEETLSNIAGLDGTALDNEHKKINRSLTFIAPKAESESPNYNWQRWGLDRGICCFAMDFMSLDEAYKAKFGTYSYYINLEEKEDEEGFANPGDKTRKKNLRKPIQFIEPTQTIENPKFNKGKLDVSADTRLDALLG